MIILLLLLEAGWLYSLYHAERRDFRYVTGKFIEDAIKEEIYTCPIQETNGLDDFSMKGRLIMTYTYKGKYFHIDTNSQLFLVFTGVNFTISIGKAGISTALPPGSGISALGRT